MDGCTKIMGHVDANWLIIKQGLTNECVGAIVSKPVVCTFCYWVFYFNWNYNLTLDNVGQYIYSNSIYWVTEQENQIKESASLICRECDIILLHETCGNNAMTAP